MIRLNRSEVFTRKYIISFFQGIHNGSGESLEATDGDHISLEWTD